MEVAVLELLKLDLYSSEELFGLAVMAGVFGYAIGVVVDSIMARHGFGPFGNGFLAVLGCYVGIFARNAYISHAYGNDLAITGAMSASCATLMLMLFCMAKRRLVV